jgi:hypothetical protein
MTKSTQSQKGIVTYISLAVALVIVIGVFVYAYFFNKSDTTAVPPLPPVTERTNPEPLSVNSIYVESVTPGSKMSVDDVKLAADGYIYIYKDVSGKRITIGKSTLLTAGSQSGIAINLTSPVKDGDVIYASLVGKEGTPVKDENGNAIEMLLNVGSLMNHYENEY